VARDSISQSGLLYMCLTLLYMSSNSRATGWRPSTLLIGAVVCLCFTMRPLSPAMDVRTMHHGIISSCQSAATSEIVKRWSSLLCKQRYSKYQNTFRGLSRSHGSVRVVRTTSKVNGKCWNLTSKPPMNPLSDRHQIWRAWLRHGYLPPRKKWAQSVKGFLLPIWAKYTPNVRYATLRMFTTFFGSSNRLQPRRLHGF